jgi:hypothetical protein
MGPRVTEAQVRQAREANAATDAIKRAAKEADGWQFHTELRLDGRLPLIVGRLFRVAGQRGWFQFREARTMPDGRIEVDCFGPFRQDGTLNKAQVGAGAFRSFFGDRVTKVARRVATSERD